MKTSAKVTHTPGPWRINALSGLDGLHIQGHNGNTVIVEEDYFHFPDEMHSGQREEIAKELVANAHLITAAPDMLEALEQVIRVLEGEADTAKMVLAAIAKARGAE